MPLPILQLFRIKTWKGYVSNPWALRSLHHPGHLLLKLFSTGQAYLAPTESIGTGTADCILHGGCCSAAFPLTALRCGGDQIAT